MEIDPFVHFVSATCGGEYCGNEINGEICGSPASHKIGEEIPADHPSNDENIPIRQRMLLQRHNFTMYVCCECFGKIFGRLAKKFCEDTNA